MSRFTQPRRWSALWRRLGLGQISEYSISPEEARTALLGLLLELGYEMHENRGNTESYNPKKDEFAIKAWDPHGHCYEDIYIPGEVVAKVVMAMRHVGGTFGKQLLRPSEIKRLVSEADTNGATDIPTHEILRER